MRNTNMSGYKGFIFVEDADEDILLERQQDSKAFGYVLPPHAVSCCEHIWLENLQLRSSYVEDKLQDPIVRTFCGVHV